MMIPILEMMKIPSKIRVVHRRSVTRTSKHGVPLKVWAKKVGCSETLADPTLVAALALGEAYSLIITLDHSLYRRELIIPALEQAWRELLFLRSCQTENLQEDFLTRYGYLGSAWRRQEEESKQITQLRRANLPTNEKVASLPRLKRTRKRILRKV